MPFFAMALLVAFLPDAANAQNRQEKPTPPFVAPLPDFFQWTITIDDSAHPAKPPESTKPATPLPPAIQKVVCTKTKNIKRDVIIYNNGGTFELWYYDGKVIARSPGGGVAICGAGGFTAAALVPDVSEEGFVWVDWITAANFQKETKLADGRDVYVYSGTATASKSISPPPVVAEIDVESGLPLLVKRDTRTLTYSYQAPPPQMLVLPADCLKELSAIEAREDFAAKLRSLSRH